MLKISASIKMLFKSVFNSYFYLRIKISLEIKKRCFWISYSGYKNVFEPEEQEYSFHLVQVVPFKIAWGAGWKCFECQEEVECEGPKEI